MNYLVCVDENWLFDVHPTQASIVDVRLAANKKNEYLDSMGYDGRWFAIESSLDRKINKKKIFKINAEITLWTR